MYNIKYMQVYRNNISIIHTIPIRILEERV